MLPPVSVQPLPQLLLLIVTFGGAVVRAGQEAGQLIWKVDVEAVVLSSSSSIRYVVPAVNGPKEVEVGDEISSIQVQPVEEHPPEAALKK